jgi:hypothetical protein
MLKGTDPHIFIIYERSEQTPLHAEMAMQEVRLLVDVGGGGIQQLAQFQSTRPARIPLTS